MLSRNTAGIHAIEHDERIGARGKEGSGLLRMGRKPPIEPHHQMQAAGSFLLIGCANILQFLFRQTQRFFDKHMFIGQQTLHHECSVAVVPGADQHGVDPGIVENGLRITGAVGRLKLFGE